MPSKPSSLPSPSEQIPRWRKFALGFTGLIAAGIVACGLGAALILVTAYPNLPDVSGLSDYRPHQPLRIWSAEGKLLAEFGEERRQYLAIEEIPQVMQDAILAIEDARFYQHGGVDYWGVLRAGLANLQESRSQGASTITMQVARNFYLSSEKTLSRKLYEILLALRIESTLSKRKILEIYMNQIFLGHRAYGFAAASEVYFGKPLKHISAAEAAMLAGLPKAPSAYNPIANPKRARIRQQYILDRMLENGFLNVQQHTAAKSETLKIRTASPSQAGADYAAEAARQLLLSRYGDELYSRGLSVTLSVRHDEQQMAYKALRKGLMEYERRQFYRGPEAHVDLPADPKLVDARVAEVLADFPANGELFSAVVLEASPKKVVASLQTGEVLTLTGDSVKPVASGLQERGDPKVQIRRGAVVRVIADGKLGWVLTQVPEVEGALVSLDPRTGAIRAMVGGFDFAKNKFNHVTQAWRQPGSSFKPFIYSAALERGFTPSTVVNDAPLFFDATTTGSQPWEPKNYDGTFEGPMTLRKALAKSKNMVSIRVLRSVGTHEAQSWIGRFGFPANKHPAYLTMALGAGSVTPLQMAEAYSVFANGGHRIESSLIQKIVDDHGKVLFEAPPVTLDEANRTLDARNAFLMSSLLQEVTRSGTAARAQVALKRTDLYGKTGTTNDSMDAWFAGYQPELVTVVWVGYDTPRKLGSRETGGGLALPIWIDFMQFALRQTAVAEIPPPEGVVYVNGEWYFDEFVADRGVTRIENDDPSLPSPANAEEKKGVLDLFKQP
ncbi:penicillin-binding protein 1A [Inhella gelatinilytica]|uniref:Penicillin-binding protein 1A n=1 Tax=Inhella gelatinilytica TaxID=2795030 RepID=A0A931NEE5_9BURK|nr:penicillin-binding protein 1A [Inhella gelatinilytica]MBH9552426.1 penicillin-binding protein 1A [Inhella gelatinilytica]